MRLEQVLQQTDIYISAQESVQDALNMLQAHSIQGLPIVDQGLYIGYILGEELHALSDWKQAIPQSAIHVNPIFLSAHQHIYEAFQQFSAIKLDFIPLVDFEQHYIGLLRPMDIIEAFSQLQSSLELGAILSISLPRKDYSLTHLAYLIENEKGKILSLSIQEQADEELLLLSIRLDSSHNSAVIASLRRHDYQVQAQYHGADREEDTDLRFENLMKYLQM